MQSILDDLNSDAALAFYNGGEEMDDITRELLKESLEMSIRTAKKRAQKKIHPLTNIKILNRSDANGY